MRSPLLRFLQVLLSLCALAGAAAAQVPCRGDIDDDGFVMPGDLNLAEIIVFMAPDDVDPGTAMRADANADQALTAADLSVIVDRQGFMCPPGPSRTPTRTVTRTPTATRTRTPTPTATPTQTCVTQPVTPGVVNGALTNSDCRRTFGTSSRFTDAYSITAAPNQAIKIEVESTGSGGTYPPYVRVIDPNGYFDVAEGAPPIEFTTTTSLPYLILVTSSPIQDQQLGSYRMTISTRMCEVVPLTTRVRSIDGTECPDLASPSVGARRDLADIYTFEIVQPLTEVEIKMRQSSEESNLDPIITVYGPGGFEAFPSFQADDAATDGFGFDAYARFIAVEQGTYTLVASGGGCVPGPDDACGYSIAFQTRNCRTTDIGEFQPGGPKVVAGTLYGDEFRTACRAPATVPGYNEFGEPEVNSPSDAYTFVGSAGDVFSAQMESDGDSQLSLFGPAHAGNPFVAQNDVVDSGFISQLAATLPQDGTYTLFAVNRTFLEPPDPNDPEDLGDFEEYEVFVQKCPVSGGLQPATGATVNARFRVFDCVGFGGYPFRTYAFNGTAGQVISTTMSSTAVDPALSLISPDRSATFNDDDPFTPASANARAVRMLPLTGTHFAEITTSREEFEPDLAASPAFTASARSCAVKPAVVGTLSDSFSDGDCDLGDGRKYDAYTLEGVAGLPARPFVVSVQPPANACVVGLLPEGPQLFDEVCTKDALDIPIVGGGPAGFLIAADQAATRGAYAARVRVCALPVVGFGSTHSASLTTAGCSDPGGARSDWILFSDRASLVRFNEGVSMTLELGFAAAATIADAHQARDISGRRSLDAPDLIGLAANLGVLIKVQGATLNDRGPYTLRIAPPLRQQ
jgi:hypothetical protein